MPENHDYPGTPRWVKIASLVVALVAALAVLHQVFGGGTHGIMMHSMPGGSQAAPAQGGNG